MNEDYVPLQPSSNETFSPTLLVARLTNNPEHMSSMGAQPTIYAQGSFPHGLRHEAIPFSQDQVPQMSSNGLIGKIEFRVSMILALITVVGTAVGVTWAVSNSISEKNNALRQELSQSILTSKQEITQRVDRVEDKIDSGFKDNTTQLNELKVLLATQNVVKKQE